MHTTAVKNPAAPRDGAHGARQGSGVGEHSTSNAPGTDESQAPRVAAYTLTADLLVMEVSYV